MIFSRDFDQMAEWSERCFLPVSTTLDAITLVKKKRSIWPSLTPSLELNAVAFYIICQSDYVPYTAADVVNITGCNKKKFRKILYLLKDKYVFKTSYSSILNKYQYDFNISPTDKKKLCSILNNNPQMDSFRPLALFCAALWLYNKNKKKERLTLASIHAVCAVSISSISRAARLMKNLHPLKF